mgnify:CR=1 FL=1
MQRAGILPAFCHDGLCAARLAVGYGDPGRGRGPDGRGFGDHDLWPEQPCGILSGEYHKDHDGTSGTGKQQSG